jgi:hypothetical protein
MDVIAKCTRELMEICAIDDKEKAQNLLIGCSNDVNRAVDSFFLLDEAVQASYRSPVDRQQQQSKGQGNFFWNFLV